uniref:Uncharacterized protein n=1 Tax=Steinernema glaseri TaxID=37863 RepID=A0A1I8AAY9_9BILA
MKSFQQFALFCVLLLVFAPAEAQWSYTPSTYYYCYTCAPSTNTYGYSSPTYTSSYYPSNSYQTYQTYWTYPSYQNYQTYQTYPQQYSTTNCCGNTANYYYSGFSNDCCGTNTQVYYTYGKK